VSRWSKRTDVLRGDQYDARWAQLAAAGESIHGEADLIESLVDPGAAVLDAGCGTGRIAIELERRDFDVVGVDLDQAMLATARSKAPKLPWIEADLETVDVVVDGRHRQFDLVAAPGNVMIFLTAGSEAAVIANLARHLAPGGLLVAGFQLGASRLSLAGYDDYCSEVGLARVHRWSTWDRRPHHGSDTYAVSVHRR
jgi:SAM-dependent methyltransferase